MSELKERSHRQFKHHSLIKDECVQHYALQLLKELSPEDKQRLPSDLAKLFKSANRGVSRMNFDHFFRLVAFCNADFALVIKSKHSDVPLNKIQKTLNEAFASKENVAEAAKLINDNKVFIFSDKSAALFNVGARAMFLRPTYELVQGGVLRKLTKQKGSQNNHHAHLASRYRDNVEGYKLIGSVLAQQDELQQTCESFGIGKLHFKMLQKMIETEIPLSIEVLAARDTKSRVPIEKSNIQKKIKAALNDLVRLDLAESMDYKPEGSFQKKKLYTFTSKGLDIYARVCEICLSPAL